MKVKFLVFALLFGSFFLSIPWHNLDAIEDVGGTAPHHTEVCNGNAQIVQTLLDAGVDKDAEDYSPGLRDLLYAAACSEDPQVVQALLDAGVNKDAGDDLGRTALHYAAEWNENPQVVQVLLDAGVDKDARDESPGWTPLYYAALFNESVQIVQALLGAGVDKDARDNYGVTVFCYVASNGNPQIKQVLLDAEVDTEC